MVIKRDKRFSVEIIGFNGKVKSQYKRLIHNEPGLEYTKQCKEGFLKDKNTKSY